jgi:anti-sigma factor (TIGR02949 family)
VNCKEVLDHLSAAVDGELGERSRIEFETHIATCVLCRNEYETEVMTKRFVRTKLPRQKAPEELRREIVGNLSSQTLSPMRGLGAKEFLENLLRRPLLRPAIGVAVVGLLVVIGISLLKSREAAAPSTDEASFDMVAQAIQHYASYDPAKLQYISSNHDEIRDYFQNKVNFKVYVPEMENSTLIGGVVCEHDGAKFLNLIYRSGDKLVYFYTACSKELKAKSKIGLSAKAQSDLEKTGWYFDTRPDCNVAVWKENDEICSAVSDMGKEKLLALLKEGPEER